MTALFIAVEGPNGAGKSTTTALLAGRLSALTGTSVHTTTEPTSTPLGQLIRHSEGTLQGRAFALAIAADRAAHIETEIIPALDAGRHVITDRYVQSSLVLQALDGLDQQEIWAYNRYVLPAITFYLEEDPAVIAARLAARPRRSRLEMTGGPSAELELYRAAAAFLGRHGWQQHVIDCRGKDPGAVTGEILTVLSASYLPDVPCSPS